jgi:fumarate hydratase class II/aspartate ammonia-lyase
MSDLDNDGTTTDRGEQITWQLVGSVLRRNAGAGAQPVANGVRAFDRRCAQGLEADEERCRAFAERTVSLATALAPRLGYASAAEIVKESVRSGRSIVELASEKGGLSPADARRVLDAAKLTSPGRA